MSTVSTTEPTILISVSVSEQDLKDLLITAVEGGIGYWAEVKPGSYNSDKGIVTVREHNDEHNASKRGPWISVTTKTIAEGLQRTASAPADGGGWVFGEWLKDRAGDATIADVIFQFGVLKELRYG